MKIRKIVLGAALFLIGLPLFLTVIAVASFYALFYERPRQSGSLPVAGEEREYLLHVPTSYDPATPAPLVISLHGAALWPAAQKETSRWNEVADEHGFLVVYPSGTTLDGRGTTGVLPRVWLMEPNHGLDSDVELISALIDKLAATYNIDPKRIYANGLSNGGSMTFALSCTLADRLAAVGTVAAAHSLPASWCTDARPVPLINFHGTADRLVPYGGSAPSWLAPHPFPSVTAWTESWAQRNGCASRPVDSEIAADVTRRDYADCTNDATVVLYTIRGGGHTWPGGKPMPAWLLGRTSESVDATREMWKFFSDHPLRTD